MDGLLDYVRKSSGDADFHAKLSDQLNKSGKKYSGQVDRVLNEVLNPSQDAVAYTEFLAYKLSAAGNEIKNAHEFIEQVRRLFVAIPIESISTVSRSLTLITRQFTKAIMATEMWMRAVGPIKRLVEKITAAKPNVVTAIHADLLLIVLKSHSYDLISDLAFLRSGEFALVSLQPSQWPIEIIDYLQFWFYLGNYHAAQKQFVEAQESYTMVLTVPSNGSVSAVQVESYKKLILVSLLASGEMAPTNSRLVAASVQRTVEALAAPYLELAKVYKKSAQSPSTMTNALVNELHHIKETNAQAFTQDKNMGLIKQIIKNLVKKQICKLTQTYLTYSLADIAAQVNLTNQHSSQPPTPVTPSASASAQPPQPAQLAERYVFDMICANEVFAKLDSSSLTVRFLDDPEEYDSSHFIQSMDRRINDVATLTRKLAEVEKELQLKPAYILKSGILRGQRTGGTGMGASESDDIALARALSVSGEMEDEDLKMAMEASLMTQ